MPTGVYKRTKEMKTGKHLLGRVGNNKGKHWKLTQAHKNILSKNSARYWKGKKMPDETRRKISLTKGGRFLKDKNGNWKEDRNKLKKDPRKDLDTQYKYWMLEVKKRDSWKCRLLSSDCKGRLEAHHIFNWTDYPELRYVLTNGITLCRFHHPLGREEEKRMIPIFQELLTVSKD